jgi:hypothetical protein
MYDGQAGSNPKVRFADNPRIDRIDQHYGITNDLSAESVYPTLSHKRFPEPEYFRLS